MSFDIKYDRDGVVIRQPEPQFEEQPIQAPVEIEQVAQEVQEHIEEEVVQQPVVQKTNVAQESWKILREKADCAEKRAAELERMLLEREKEHDHDDEPEENLDISIEDDSLVEGKHLSKVSKKIQNLEKQLRQYEKQSSVTSTETRLKAKYADFDAVVSIENLDHLRNVYPEIAQTIDSSNDLYSKAVTAYTMIKRLGILPQEDVFKNEKEMAHRNSLKPKSLASISPQQGDSPLSKANAFANGTLTEDDKSRIWKEMNQYRRG